MQPKILHHFGGGVYAKETHVPAGMVLVQHKHAHDHLSILSAGTVEVIVEGVRSEVTGPACLTIKAGIHHGIKAITDAIWYCVHATECQDEDEVDSVLIMPGKMADVQAIAESLS